MSIVVFSENYLLELYNSCVTGILPYYYRDFFTSRMEYNQISLNLIKTPCFLN